MTRPTRILIVDDETLLARNVSQYLCHRGHVLEIAECAAQARKHLESDQVFDVLILDVNLPDMDGLEFYAAMAPRLEQTRVLVITGQSCPQVALRAADLGVSACLTKPFSLRTLAELIGRCVAPPTKLLSAAG